MDWKSLIPLLPGGRLRSHHQLVDAAFRVTLSRRPTRAERRHWLYQLVAGNLDAAELIAELAGPRPDTPPHRRLRGPIDDPVAQLPEHVQTASHRLEERTSLPAASFERVWSSILDGKTEQDLVVGQADYLRTHNRRFHELFNAVTALTGDAPRMLEFGTSEASRLYTHIKPQGVLVTADRPVAADYIGFTPDKTRRLAGSQAHVEIDLEAGDPAVHPALRAAGPFDLIVFTEVLEHLVADPHTLVAGLLHHLSDTGYLYLTTPNFLSRRHRDTLAGGRNPLAYYPGRAADWDRHHHFREYTMAELLDMARACDAPVHAAYYSDCWDPADDAELAAWPDLRSNLVLVLGPGPGPAHGRAGDTA